MSINLSTIQLTHPGFVEFVVETVKHAGLRPGQILVERSLVSLVATDPRAESVVTGITDLARRLGAVCIAEGVEDSEQLVRLRRMGCQLAQGFHFSSALPAAELEALLRVEPRGRWSTLVRRAVDPHSAGS
jgi:EAL domain-containing protein (putative c-di-GMP-specific phosphodiesterase class I)